MSDESRERDVRPRGVHGALRPDRGGVRRGRRLWRLREHGLRDGSVGDGDGRNRRAARRPRLAHGLAHEGEGARLFCRPPLNRWRRSARRLQPKRGTARKTSRTCARIGSRTPIVAVSSRTSGWDGRTRAPFRSKRGRSISRRDSNPPARSLRPTAIPQGFWNCVRPSRNISRRRAASSAIPIRSSLSAVAQWASGLPLISPSAEYRVR